MKTGRSGQLLDVLLIEALNGLNLPGPIAALGFIDL